jgi:pyridoxine 5-phosphate synthase
LAANDTAKAEAEFARLKQAAKQGASLGLEIHAGHGLDYTTAEEIAALPEIAELNIGHFLVGEAVFVGFGNTIARMRAATDRGRAATGAAA